MSLAERIGVALCLACALAGARAAPEAVPMPGTAIHWLDEPVLGGQIAVYEAGAGKPRAILLVHGIGESGARDFREQVAWLRSAYHVVAPDLPGFGLSDRANALYSPANYTDALRRVARRFLGRPFVLVGHSMGGVVALRYAATYPEDVERLVVLDAPGVLHPLSSTSQLVANLGLGFIPPFFDPSLEIAGLARRLLAPLARTRFDPQVILASPRLRQTVLNGDPAKIAGLAAVSEDLRDAMPRLHMPVLLVWGADDRLAPPRAGRVLAQKLPQAALHMMDGVGHTPMLEAPGRLRRVLEPFAAGGALPPAEHRGPIAEARGDGRCAGERGRIFEGTYDSLTIEGCSRAVVRFARVRELRIENSSVVLEDSVVGGGEIGMRVRNSSVEATGSRIEGDVALVVNSSRLDLAAVEIEGREAAIRAETGAAGVAPLPSMVVLSLCRVQSPRSRGELHDVYTITAETPL